MTNKWTIVGSLLVWTVTLCVADAAAEDTINRTSSNTAARGSITEISRTKLVLKTRRGQVVEVPVNEITRVRWDGEKPSLNQVRSLERAGELQAALEGYQEELKKTAPANTNLKTDLTFLIARTTAKLATADESQLDKAIEQLEQFRNQNADHFRYYELLTHLARLYLIKKDYEKAHEVVGAMSEAPWEDYKLAAQISAARIRLAQDDPDGALAAFDDVIDAPAEGPEEMARRYEAMLGKASCLQALKRTTDAVQTFERIIDEASAQETSILAEAYIRQGDCLLAAGRQKEALLAYLHVDVLFRQESALHAEALYHLSQLWELEGKPDRAAAAAATLQQRYGKSEWAAKLTVKE